MYIYERNDRENSHNNAIMKKAIWEATLAELIYELLTYGDLLPLVGLFAFVVVKFTSLMFSMSHDADTIYTRVCANI